MKKYLGFAAGIAAMAVLAFNMPAQAASTVTMADSKDLAKTIRFEDNEDVKVDVREVSDADAGGRNSDVPGYLRKVRLSWEPVPGAVSYQVAIMRANKNIPENVVSVKRGIFTNGYELDTSVMRAAKDYYWKVCPLDASGHYIKLYSDLKPLVGQELNPTAPKPTTEFESMAYAPLYPVFS